MTRSLLVELSTVLSRSKFDYYATIEQRQAFIRLVFTAGTVIPVVTTVSACRDPRDNHILEAAVNGGAQTIVTGDRDLLALDPYHGIRVVTAAEYLQS